MNQPPLPTFTDRERKFTLGALMVVFLLSALDQTIVSTAMPRIISELKGLDLYAWVATAYMLTSTVMVPIYGKLSDLYGRKPILVMGIGLFLLGSWFCGLSGEPFLHDLFGGGMMQLIVFRALQGLGGAALFTSAFAIIADMFAPQERGRFMGMFGAVFGLASVIGPAIGGFFTDHGTVTLLGHVIQGWRWVFYVNLPLGLLSLFLILVMMPKLSHAAKGKIDVLGALLIILTTVPLLLALTWGGNTYAWNSAVILGLFAGSAVSLVLFILVEARNPDAILPLSLFKNRVFATANSAGFVIGMAFLGVIMFLPLFMQLVQGVSATNSGFSMLPLMAGLMLSSIVSGQLVSKIGKYKPFMIAGGLVLLVGVWLMTQIGPETSTADLAWRLFVVGLGLGPSQSLYNLAVQNAVPVTQLGIATSASQFFRQIGSTIGVAIFGTLLTHNLAVEMPKHLPAMPGMAQHEFNLSELRVGGSSGDLSSGVQAAFDRQFQQIERAVHGDRVATEQLLSNERVPAPLKAALQRGIPAQAAEPMLKELKQVFEQQAKALGERMMKGIKEGFSLAITHMFGTSILIILIGFVITLLIPEVPLRERVRKPDDEDPPAVELATSSAH